MTQEEKLQSLADWLRDHEVDFATVGDKEIDARLVIRKPRRIAVFVCDKAQEDLNYQAAAMAKFRAFFIREDDAPDFVIEKMRNCLKGWTTAQAKRFAEAAAKKPKRKRIHISKPVYEKVGRG